MKKVLFKEVLVDFRTEVKEIYVDCYEDAGCPDEAIRNYISEYFSNAFKKYADVIDKEIVIEDLHNEEGYVYKFFENFYDDDIIKDSEMALCGYEYSLEEVLRDTFATNEQRTRHGFELFDEDDLNEQLYGRDEETTFDKVYSSIED